ncbi:MAG: 5'/3'-nucleotidase SurE [Candidatus Cloacimonadaceae bacterium]|nr:5'/3'-nucleotidase SurE [Candidatus Cloacimonadaceae bacterium]MDP3114603.1 5'/3'-nucleotidase SurE [Candidatus Cloacimonadaceae bacterium]
MRILAINDDGIQALGIRTLIDHLRQAGHEVIIVAPDRERSAASHSLTLRKDLRVTRIAELEYSVDGTPVDCTVIALQKLITGRIDLVISGINAGQNMGEDVLYSGTVAAAVEASFFGHKAIAISINSYTDQRFETAAAWMVKLLDMGIEHLISPREILNINVPNVPPEAIRGIRLTRVGHRKYYNFIKIMDQFEDGFSYRIGGDQPIWDLQKGTDAEAINENYISITPLGFEMTRGDSFPQILEWLEEHNLLQLEN